LIGSCVLTGRVSVVMGARVGWGERTGRPGSGADSAASCSPDLPDCNGRTKDVPTGRPRLCVRVLASSCGPGAGRMTDGRQVGKLRECGERGPGDWPYPSHPSIRAVAGV